MTDLILFLPELYLALTAIGLVLGEVGYHGERVRMILATALLSVGGAGFQLLLNYTAGAGRYGHENFVNDGFSLFLKVILLVAAGIALIADRKSHESPIEQRTEHAAMVLGATALGMLAVSAVSWLWILPLLFSVQITGSLLMAMKKLDFKAVESAFKTNVSAIVALLLLSIGVLLFYSATGEFDLYRIHAKLLEIEVPTRLYATGFCLIIVAFGFFGTYFPSQLWAKDAYEGASLPVTAFAATLFRITSFGTLIRVMVIQFSKESEVRGLWVPMTGVDWTPIVATVAGVTLVMGALYSFRQTETRKLFSGVMVFQSGFYLLGLLALDQIGFASILFGLLSEVFMVAGFFAALSFFEDRTQKDESLGRLSRSVPEGVALLLFLVCVVGLPPLPGFLSKFTLISAASRHGWNGLSLLALASLALVSVAAFRWIYPWIGTMRYKNEAIPVSWSHRFLFVGLALPLLLISVFAESALIWVGSSVSFLLW